MIAAVATLGSGVPMGLEGPSLYLGATLGDTIRELGSVEVAVKLDAGVVATVGVDVIAE